MDRIDCISPSLTSTLVKSDLSSLVKNGAELGIDSIMKDGVAKEIPIVGTIVGLIKSTQSIGNWLFLRKIISFLKELNDIEIRKREEMINKIDDSKKYRIKVGDQLLYIIESCDDDLKAEYVAILFKAFINEQVSYDDFIKGSSIINKLTIADFDKFINNKTQFVDETEFLGVGLTFTYTSEISVDENDDYKSSGPSYIVKGGETVIETTPIGNLLIQVFRKQNENQ